MLGLLRPGTAPAVPYDGKLMERLCHQSAARTCAASGADLCCSWFDHCRYCNINQAGAIGAIGATIMAGYRLREGEKDAFHPAILAIVSLVAILVLMSVFDLNIRTIETSADKLGILLAVIAVVAFCFAVGWSLWRTFKIEDTLNGVMVESAKTTSMVFIILLGAAMLTAAFRGFGVEEIVEHFLTGLPGGFWAQFIVVMLVIFLLGFFLDFIEIAVVVVPIVSRFCLLILHRM